MTVILACKDHENRQTIICADSAYDGIGQETAIRYRSGDKLWVGDGWAVGTSGEIRYIESCKKAILAAGNPGDEWRDVLGELHDDWMNKYAELPAYDTVPQAEFLVVQGNEFALIAADGTTMRETERDCLATGIGANYAEAAFLALEEETESNTACIVQVSMETAEYLCPHVAGPFHTHVVPWGEE